MRQRTMIQIPRMMIGCRYVAKMESANNNEFAVEWSKDHDFSVLEEAYGLDVADIFNRLSSTFMTLLFKILMVKLG
jgi:hypothetical protein